MSLPRLAIIVPYRDRQEHLQQFLPHIQLYFARDKIDKNIPYTITIVEQTAGKPFNRGKLKNVGFDLTKDAHDYFCFHDVDYLPIWADYRYTERPTLLLWWGIPVVETRETFLGGVVAFNRRDFLAVNGYPNEYWGWGAEDTELRMRCDITGIKRDIRDGVFKPLPHTNLCYTADRTLTPEAARNLKQLKERERDLAGIMQADGLSSLQYQVAQYKIFQAPLPQSLEVAPVNIHHYFVEV